MATSRVRRSVVLGVVGSLLFAGGLVLGGAATLANLPPTERLAIGARATIEAYHADGTLYARWQGRNALTALGRNTIAACLSGLDTTPNTGTGFSSTPTTGCTSLSHSLRVRDTGVLFNFDMTKVATKSMLPAGCTTDGQGTCTGWKLEATFDAEITQVAGIDTVFALFETGGGQFNQLSISPDITVSPGDRLIITLNFDVP